MTIRTFSLPACALLVALTACSRQLNERPTLANAVLTGTFAPETWHPAAPEPAATPPVSARGTDRSAWPAHVFLVPVDGTVHGPVRHHRVRLVDTTRRQQGLFPTIDSALDLDGNTRGTQALEGLLAPLAATLELALLPVSAVTDPPFTDVQSPGHLYKRTEQTGWSSAPGFAPGAPDGAPTIEPSS